MGRNKYDSILKSKIISDYYNGELQSSIAKKYKINKSIISRLIKKYKKSGTVENLNFGGRPRKTSARTDRKIINLIKKEPFISSREIVGALDLSVDPSTVRRRAIENNLKSFSPCKKPVLTKRHVLKRLNFAKTHLNWTTNKWKTVLFSDESKFNLVNSDGKCHVRRIKGQRLNPRYCKGTVKHGGGNVMVWTCFSAQGLGPFHETTEKMDRFIYKNILETQMLPYAEWEMPLRWVFQHDNDPKHTSKLVKDWISAKGIQVLDWPAQSPDLNPIENLFGILKRRVGSKRHRNKGELMTALREEWKNIPMTIVSNLIESMPRRCVEVIQNKGYYTKY